jgi:hypothetical protein
MKVMRRLAAFGLSAVLTLGTGSVALAIDVPAPGVTVSNTTQDVGLYLNSTSYTGVDVPAANDAAAWDTDNGGIYDGVTTNRAWFITVDTNKLVWNVTQQQTFTPAKITWNKVTHEYEKTSGHTGLTTTITDANPEKTITIQNDSNMPVSLAASAPTANGVTFSVTGPALVSNELNNNTATVTILPDVSGCNKTISIPAGEQSAEEQIGTLTLTFTAQDFAGAPSNLTSSVI